MPIDALLERLKGPDLADRDEAADELEDLAHDGLGGPLLVAALQREDHGRVRREAARALGLMGHADPGVIDALCGLFHERSDKLKRTAARALARIGSAAIPALLEALQETNEYARADILWTLGQIGERSTLEIVMATFWNSDGMVARAAARALAKIDFQSALHNFSEATRGWSWERPAIKGRQGLLQLGIETPDPIDIIEATVMGGDALTAFEISQGKGNIQVLLGAIRGLGERRDEREESINVLLDSLEYQDNVDVRREAMLALRRIKGHDVRRGVLQSFQNTQLQEGPRMSAAELLGLLKERQALGPLREALCDVTSTPMQLRNTIARTYPRFRDPGLISDLLVGLTALLQAEDELEEFDVSITAEAIRSAIEQIASHRFPETLRFALLREALSCPPHGYSWRAAWTLLETWPDDQNRELAISYANQHREPWAEIASQPLQPFPEE